MGGYFVRGELRCRGLETDYINGVVAARDAALVRGINPSSEALADVSEKLVDAELEGVEVTLNAIYEECGRRAGQTAARKGSQALLGS